MPQNYILYYSTLFTKKQQFFAGICAFSSLFEKICPIKSQKECVCRLLRAKGQFYSRLKSVSQA